MGNISDKVTDAKSWFKSKAIIGTIIMILPTIIKMIKPELTVDLDAAVEHGFTLAEAIAANLDSTWVTVLEVGGLILTSLGIRGAKKPIKGL